MRNLFKKCIALTTTIVFIMSMTVLSTQAAEEQKLTVDNAEQVTNEKETSISVDSDSNYIQDVYELLDDGYDSVYVIFTDLNKDTNFLTKAADKDLASIGPVKKYFVKNVKKAADYNGKSRVATASGSPGVKISIEITKEIDTTLSATFGATKGSISAAVGWDVTGSTKIAISGSYKVPSKVNGRKVKKGHLDAYPVYKTKKFDVYYGIQGTSKAEKKGTGTTRKAIGYYFKKRITYK